MTAGKGQPRFLQPGHGAFAKQLMILTELNVVFCLFFLLDPAPGYR
jgi:hypothetical protein